MDSTRADKINTVKRLYLEYRKLSDSYVRFALKYAEYCDIRTFKARAKADQYRLVMHRIQAFKNQTLVLLRQVVQDEMPTSGNKYG